MLGGLYYLDSLMIAHEIKFDQASLRVAHESSISPPPTSKKKILSSKYKFFEKKKEIERRNYLKYNWKVRERKVNNRKRKGNIF